MCFDLDSRPPIAPIAGGAIDTEEIVLRAGDGGRFAGLLARAEVPSGAGIIVLPDVRGLHPYYEELALRFAEVGVDALAIDYFGRTAGIGVRERPTDFDFMTHVGETRFSTLSWDVQAAADRLRSLAPAACGPSSRSGSCFGGRLAFLANTLGRGWPGRSASTAGPWAPGGHPGPGRLDRADDGAGPGVFGGADGGSRPRPSRPSATPWRRPASPRGRDLSGRPALVLRPQGGRSSGTRRRCLERVQAFIRTNVPAA